MEVIISKDNKGWDISVYNIDNEKIKTTWKQDKIHAYAAAEVFANYYRDENGQMANVKLVE